MDAQPLAALVFYWKSVNRQVRVRGSVDRVTDAEADTYFASRPEAGADRRLGEQAICTSGKPPRLREGGRALCREIRHRRRPAATQLVRLPNRADLDRVLAGASHSVSTIASSSNAIIRTTPGPRRGSIRELASTCRSHARTIPETTCPVRKRTSRAARCSSPEQAAASVTRRSNASRLPGGASSRVRGIRFRKIARWEAGPEDHIQVDLADEANTVAAIAEIRRRLEGHELHALVNNAAISPKADGGKRLGSLDTSH